MVCAFSFSTSTLAVNSCSRDSSRVRSSSKLDFFGGKFFEPDDVALLLQIERGDFVADARQILRGGKRGGLRLRAIPPAPFQIIFNLVQRELFLLQRQPVLRERGFGRGQVSR